MRINQYLATSGVASRRASEQIIKDGRVSVNGKKVTDLSVQINPDNDHVLLDGKKLSPIKKHLYIMLHKPKGFITSTKDEHDRKTIMNLLEKKYLLKRVFPIGRLDYETEGLLLMTTDGDLCASLTHPKFEVPKTYVVKIEGEITEIELNKIRDGIILDGAKTKKCKAKILEHDNSTNTTRVEVIISQGLNRQIRRMFEAINKQVVFLKRTHIGNLRLGGLSRGETRELKPEEIVYLKSLGVIDIK
ncbi:MAG: rRNA pseudouridine synthase [Firmicutes bacterium]|nr:rRNA pseudouridine synthase [Bacillota bacterium]MCL2255728.1 rRNA pseudouridine synthase [Bacillota bacterium]